MRRLADHAALACNADGRTRVVTSTHPAREVRGAESLNGGRRAGLDLVLENNETKETQARLSLLALEFLRFEPG